MCPPCAGRRLERWRLPQQARLLACEPYPVIFALPHALSALGLANGAGMPTRLFASRRATWLELSGEAASLGATPGSMATLHPWRQARLRPPQLPARVTGGGLSSPGHGVAVRPGFVLPSRGAMAACRGQRLAALRRAVRRGQLQRPEGRRPPPGEHRLHKLGRQQGPGPSRER
jgi:hypothetical protein